MAIKARSISIDEVAHAHCVVQTVLATRPGRFFAAGDMLSRYPPHRHFGRFGRITDVEGRENVALVARPFRRYVGVVRIHVEAVYADAMGFLKMDELRFAAVGDVVTRSCCSASLASRIAPRVMVSSM
jgi:hypothetical protein